MRVHRRRRRLGVAATLTGDRAVEIGRAGPGESSARSGCSTAGTHAMSVRVDRDGDGARARPAGLRRAAGPPAPVGVQPEAPPRGAPRPRACAPSSSTSPARSARRPSADERAAALAELEYCKPPDSRYVRRMATFHDFDPLALWGFLTSGQVRPVPAGPHAARRGGALDGLLPDDQRRGREGAGARRPPHPRRAGGPRQGVRLREPHRRPAVARSRRSRGSGRCLLVLPRDPFEQLFNGEDAISRGFLDVIQRDLMTTLRETLRPLARLAASV